MIETVRGPVSIEDLGITSAHEHIFIDMRNCVKKTGDELPEYHQKLNIKNRGLVFSNPYAILDNALLEGFEDAVFEIELFKAAGGNTVIDCTLDEIGRDPLTLRRISEKTGVNIILGCGNYYHIAHPAFVDKETVGQLAERICRDLTVGIGDTGIKAGIIGEIGTSAQVTDNEKKVLRAAGIVSAEIGKPIHVHTDLYTENGIEIIDILESEGVKPQKICIDHVDVWLRKNYILSLLDRGVFVEFDNFGKEFYIPQGKRFAYDLERIDMLCDIIRRGYKKQVLVSNDICLKSMWRTFGGTGYAHILTNVRTIAEEKGIAAEYQEILTENVKAFLK